MPSSRCHNVFFAALFFAFHVILFPVAWAAAGSSAGKGGGLSPAAASAVRSSLVVAAFSAVGFGAAWAYLLYTWIRGPGVSRVFIFSHGVSASLFLLQACVFLFSGHALVALVIFSVLIGDAAWFRAAQRDRLLFVELELQLVDRVLFANRSLVAVMSCLMAVQLVFSLVWGTAFVSALEAPRSTAVPIVIFLFVSFRWATGVVKHTATTVVANATTAWLTQNALRRSRNTKPPVPVDALTGGQPVPTLRGVPNAGVDEDDEEIAAVLSDVSALLRHEAPARPGNVRRGGADMSDVSLVDILPPAAPAAASAALADTRLDDDASSGLARARAAAVTTAVPLAQEGPGSGFVVEHATDTAASEASRPAPAVSSAPASSESISVAPPQDGSSEEDSDFVVRMDLWPVLRESVMRSFGAIAAGALLGIMSSIAWPLLRASRAVSHFQYRPLAGLGRRAVVALRAYLRLTNKYTFVLVGTKRASWFPASRQTWLLMTRAGLEALVADDASDRLLLTCCYIGGSAASLFLSGILSVPSGDWILTLGVVFWFGFVGVALPLTVLDACVSTLIVSFSQVPEVLSAAQPLIYNRFLHLTELELLTQHARRTGVADGDAVWHSGSAQSEIDEE